MNTDLDSSLINNDYSLRTYFFRVSQGCVVVLHRQTSHQMAVQLFLCFDELCSESELLA